MKKGLGCLTIIILLFIIMGVACSTPKSFKEGVSKANLESKSKEDIQTTEHASNILLTYKNESDGDTIYNGKTVEFTGTVNNVTEKFLFIKSDNEEVGNLIQCEKGTFKFKEADFPKGCKVLVKANCRGIKSGNVYFTGTVAKRID